MKRILAILIILCLLAGQAWGATKTVCSSGCDYATATDALESNAQSAGTIIEFQADTPGGSKTWTVSTSGTGVLRLWRTVRGIRGAGILEASDKLTGVKLWL